MPLEAELYRGGVHWLAIVKLDRRTQLDDETFIVVDPLPLGRELRDDVELRADIDELVAERGEDDAADIGARQRGVEDVGVLGKPDPQCRLRRCGGGEQADRQQSRCRNDALRRHSSSQFIPGPYARATPSAAQV